jgi:hypothetical protein
MALSALANAIAQICAGRASFPERGGGFQHLKTLILYHALRLVLVTIIVPFLIMQSANPP